MVLVTYDDAFSAFAEYHGQKKARRSDEEVVTPLDAKEGFTFGCDPEGFIFDTKKELYVSAAGLIPGTKESPHPVEGGAVQVDGMAAEFNTEPVSTFRDFNANIEKVIKQLTAMLPENHELRFVPSVVFDKKIFDASPEDAKELGCTPDFNAWEGCPNPPPCDPDNPYLRTGSGHLHIGWPNAPDDINNEQHVMNCRDLVKQLDWFLGGWSVKIDTDATRRKLYGKAGACRYKPYGVEYRVLSNFWVTSRDRRLAVWNRMQMAIDMMAKKYLPDRAMQPNNDALIEGINQSKFNEDFQNIFAYPLTTTNLGHCRV